MITIALGFWALFLGIFMLKLSMGLHGTLLGVRATMEGFGTESTGLVMSAYFMGFLFSSFVTPKIIVRVGHVRVFAALASMASIGVLLHVVFVEPFFWGLLRVLTGFCYAGLYMVAESWLNNNATNKTRGRTLSIYMVLQLTGAAGGQFLLNLDDPREFELFVLVSALVSLSLVPILLSVSPEPRFEQTEHIDLKTIFAIAPLGVVGVMGSGMANGALLSMGAVFASERGFSLGEISLFMSVTILGGGLMQWPLGMLSDHINRRLVITGVSALATISAIGVTMTNPAAADPFLFLLSALFGGFSLSLYSLCLAFTTDFLRKEQMVGASSALILVSGFGSVLGPMLASFIMGSVGPRGFFWFLASVHLTVVAFAIYRMFVKPPLPVEEQGAFIAVPPRATPEVALLIPDPDDVGK